VTTFTTLSLRRDTNAITIPYGQPVRLPEGTSVTVLQTLGGNYTVQVPSGDMVRIDAADADALGLAAEASPPPAAGATERPLEERVWDLLRTCFDPEIPVNIVDLGLVYECVVAPDGAGHRVDIRLTLTAPGCGMGDVLKQDIERKVAALPGVATVSVRLVVDPPWHQGMMSDAAKLQLGLL
jgi:probable FeS assembly SUF system protein SufT